MLQGEHSAILSTFIKLPFVIQIFVLSIFEWPLKTGFTVLLILIGMSFIFVYFYQYVNSVTSVYVIFVSDSPEFTPIKSTETV